MKTKRRLTLINLRNKKGWLQRDVVSELKNRYGIEITESYYGMIEQGVRTPKLNIAVAISKLFESEIDVIFFNNLPNETLGKEAI